jgi:hypothetical protein
MSDSFRDATASNYSVPAFTGIARPAAGAARESELTDGPMPLLPSLREFLPSNLDDKQDGGLIDIDSQIDPSSGDAVWRPLDRYMSAIDDGDVARARDEQNADSSVTVDILVDAAFDSEWSADSQEGGMIELAAVPAQAAAASAPEATPGPWRDIRIDKGLARFQAFEVAAAPSEHPTPSAQDTDPDLPVDTTASAAVQEAGSPEASAAAATELHAKADHHAAAPAILFATLLTGLDRKSPQTSARGRSRENQAKKRTIV